MSTIPQIMLDTNALSKGDKSHDLCGQLNNSPDFITSTSERMTVTSHQFDFLRTLRGENYVTKSGLKCARALKFKIVLMQKYIPNFNPIFFSLTKSFRL